MSLDSFTPKKRPLDSGKTQRSNKKRREYTDEDAKLAKIYNNLASEIKEVQLSAAIELLKNFEASIDAERIVDRLMRGLCSSRKAARLGFFVALTEIFKSMQNSGKYRKLLSSSTDWIWRLTEVENFSSKQEKKEHFMGRLAGWSALVHSHVAYDGFEDLKLDGDDKDFFDSFLHSVLRMPILAPHLLEQCGKLFVDIVTQAAVLGKPAYVERALDSLMREHGLHNPNGIAVWLQAIKSTPNIRFPRGAWTENDPTHPSELKNLVKALSTESKTEDSKDENGVKDVKALSHGIARREPHFVWSLLLDTLVTKAVSTQQNIPTTAAITQDQSFDNVWRLAVDVSYFGPECGPERKALGFRILTLAVQKVHYDLLATVFSPRLVSCLVNQLASTDRYLHSVANSTVDVLVEKLRSAQDPHSLRLVILTLLSNRPKGSMEHVTYSKTNSLVQRLLGAATAKSALHLLPKYATLVSDTIEKPQQNAATPPINMLAANLGVLFKAINSDEDFDDRMKCQSGIFDILATYSFPQVQSSSNHESPVQSSSKTAFRQQLVSCIKDVISATKEPMHHLLILSHALPMHQKPQGIDAEMFAAVQASLHSLNTLLSKRAEGSQEDEISLQYRAFFIIFILALLQLYCAESDAVSTLDDAKFCFEKYEKLPKKTSLSFDDVVDLCMALASKPESLYRVAAEQVFLAFASRISAEGLTPLFHILSREENIAGQRDLFDQQSDSEGVEDGASDDDDDNGNASDVEELTDVGIENLNVHADANSNAESDEEAPDSSADENDSDKGSGDDGSSVDSGDEALNASLGEILRTTKDAADPASHSDSDSDMTDTAMETLNIDAQLSTIFQQRQAASASSSSRAGKSSRESKKAEQQEAKRLVISFKSRVLGLLSIYIAARFSSPDCISVVLPLCQTIGSTRNAQIAKKSDEALERYIKIAKRRPDGLPAGVGEEGAWVVLSELHEEALLFRSKLHAAACGRGALFLARVLVQKAKVENRGKEEQAVEKTVARLKARYEETRERKQELGSGLTELFWENWRTWLTSMGLK